jgi:hypothetical protein
MIGKRFVARLLASALGVGVAGAISFAGGTAAQAAEVSPAASAVKADVSVSVGLGTGHRSWPGKKDDKKGDDRKDQWRHKKCPDAYSVTWTKTDVNKEIVWKHGKKFQKVTTTTTEYTKHVWFEKCGHKCVKHEEVTCRVICVTVKYLPICKSEHKKDDHRPSTHAAA